MPPWRMALLAGAAAAGFAPDAVVATPAIYRCGSSYQATPCGSAGRQLDIGRAPNEAERAEADAVAQREAELAARMTEQRERAEASLRPARAAGFDARARRQADRSGKAASHRKASRSEAAAERRRAEENGTAYRAPPATQRARSSRGD